MLLLLGLDDLLLSPSTGLMMTEDEFGGIVASMKCPTRRFTGRIEANAGKAPIDVCETNYRKSTR